MQVCNLFLDPGIPNAYINGKITLSDSKYVPTTQDYCKFGIAKNEEENLHI